MQKYDKRTPKISRGKILEEIKSKSAEILSPKEIESYVRGFMLRAKRENKAFTDIVTEFIDSSFYYGNKPTIMNYPVYSELKIIEDNTIIYADKF